MKKYIIKSLFIVLLLSLYSCEDYLDKAPEASLSIEDVFADFKNAQGFVDEMHSLVVDYPVSNHTFADYMYGDDAYTPASFKFSRVIDRGELMSWVNFKYSYLNNVYTESNKNDVTNKDQKYRPGLWKGSWAGIRKANIVIENIDLMVNATQKEKDVILGQAYFFRAFFHNEIMKYWGRIPYIKEVLTNEYELPRLATYKECALEAHEDYKKAAALLPVDWDNEPYGAETLSLNMGRVTKGAAYAFMGKNLLLAASPLMHFNNASNMDTYEYDTELCAMAVDAFAEVLKLADQGRYGLMPFDRYEEVFWESLTKKAWVGGSEFIFNGPTGNYGNTKQFMEEGADYDVTGGSKHCTSPTHNFIYNNFGMANGLSIEDDMSGAYGTPTYDPTKPFDNRDPRFYKWLIVDQDPLVVSTSATAKPHKFAQLYTGGTHRDDNGSQTGYFFKKFFPTMHSKWNNIIGNYVAMRLHMRLTDVYLMYAEALHVAKGATIAPDSYGLTAEKAINDLRDRAGVDHVNPLIVADDHKFMDEIRRERTVELSFEAHRWLDLRRWGIAHLEKYRKKTALDFPADHSYFNEVEILTRVCDYPKHYWLPFEPNQTQFYEGFEQNPGW